MRPKVCLYYLTFRCNASCEFCGIWNDKELQKIKEAPLEKHLDNLKRAGTKNLEITGGEPLLYEYLPQFLDGARKEGFFISFYTNGISYLERAKEIKGKTDKLFFSLDYPIKDEHDRSRGTECFQTVMRGINYAREIGEKPIINYTVTRDSIRFLPEIVEIAEKLKLAVYFNPVYDFEGLHGFEKNTIDHIKYFFKKPNVMGDLAVLEFIRNGGNNIAWPRCRARETTITFLPDASIAVPCPFNNGGREGREQACIGCMRWPHMIPSFSVGFDRYRLLHEWSRIIKEAKK